MGSDGYDMTTLWQWITDHGNSKIVALLLFMGTFLGILIYLFSNRGRARKMETYRFIPLEDDASPLDPYRPVLPDAPPETTPQGPASAVTVTPPVDPGTVAAPSRTPFTPEPPGVRNQSPHP
jgi:cbb3-type cytochrome oxidase subunit 3